MTFQDLDDTIDREQPSTVSELIDIIGRCGFGVEAIEVVRYYGVWQGVRVRVRDFIVGAVATLPLKRGYMYSIFG